MGKETTFSIEIEEDKYTVRVYIDGEISESYRPTSKEQAVVDMVALLNGFQPPRRLDRQDIQTH